jgi:hypothetical protein
MNKKIILICIAFLAVISIFSIQSALALTSTTETEFITTGSAENPTCLNIGDYASDPIWSINGQISGSLDDCHKEGAANDCCQTVGDLTICQQNQDTGQYSCVAGPQSCEELTQAQCTDDNFAHLSADEGNIILENQGYICGGEYQLGTNCSKKMNCKCVWTDEGCKPSTDQKICLITDSETCYQDTSLCGVDAGDEEGSGRCVFNPSIVNNCNSTGLKFMSWTTTWGGDSNLKPDYCIDDSKTIRCIASELNFFTTISIVVLLILIVMFYVYFTRKKKKI